jgi:citrate lyase subunit beta/citryl-CoA lyase
MVPKVENTGDVAFADRALTQLEQELGLQPGRIGIEAQIEDAQGLVNVDQIAVASPRVETIIFGPADFSASMQLPALTVAGGSPDYPGDLFHYVLFRLAVAARAAGIQVIDGPYLAIRDVDGYRVAAKKAAALGYDGKWCLHPDQIAPCNEAFTPTQEQFDRAVRILEAYKHATEVERSGAVMFGDEMIDEASRKMATQFFLRGQAAGLSPSPAQPEPAAAAAS